jgi:hypothetical protein
MADALIKYVSVKAGLKFGAVVGLAILSRSFQPRLSRFPRCVAVLGRVSRRRRSLIKLHWVGDHFVLNALLIDVGDEVAVGPGLGVAQHLPLSRQRRPYPRLVGQRLALVVQVVLSRNLAVISAVASAAAF